MTGSFSDVNQPVVFDNPFTEAWDSLYLKILKADTSAFRVVYDQPVVLPGVKLGQDGLDSFVLPNDLLQIDAQETRKGFTSYDRRLSRYPETDEGSEGRYVYRRWYQRILFVADDTLNIIDDCGNLLALLGRLRGSIVGSTRT